MDEFLTIRVTSSDVVVVYRLHLENPLAS
jgi:hypothetical protein